MATQAERTSAARSSLVAAAIEVLATEGLRGLTHERLAEVSGHSRGLVTYHFGSRQGLLEAVLHSIGADFVNDLVHSADARRVDGFTALLQLVDTYLAELVRAPQRNLVVLLLSTASLRESPALRAPARAVTAGLRAGVAAVVDRGLHDGSIRTGTDPGDAALVVVGLLRGLTLQWLADPDEVDMTRARSEAATALRRAYAAREQSD